MATVLERLVANDPTLTELDLTRSGLGNYKAEKLAEVLKTNTVLRSLDLSSFNGGLLIGEAVAEALKVNSTLTHLNLRGNTLVSTLMGLDLQGNRVYMSSVGAIAQMLEVNTSLKILDLGACRIGPSGMRDIAVAMSSNSTLVSLDLRYNLGTHLDYNFRGMADIGNGDYETIKKLVDCNANNAKMRELRFFGKLYENLLKIKEN
jgi:NLR family CARD domain-containing protein 3